jgi:hypothetical protein
VESLEFRETYAGLIEGRPSDELNEKYKRQHVESIRKRGHPATHVIEPPLVGGARQGRLPYVACAASLDSDAFDGESMASCLLVIWWQDELEGDIVGIVERQVRDLDWESLAKNYDI